MRIIAGIAKGRGLVVPKGGGTRPLTGRSREALFSSLGSRVHGAHVLDLFAGSGALGLEALSRGATEAVFVDSDRNAVAAIEANVAAVGLGGRVVRSEAERFLSSWEGVCDLTFVDPPHALPLASVERVLGGAVSRLRAGGTIVLHRRTGEAGPHVVGLVIADGRRYGDSQLWRLEKEEG